MTERPGMGPSFLASAERSMFPSSQSSFLYYYRRHLPA